MAKGYLPSCETGFSIRGRWREWLRDLSNRLVLLDPLLRRVFRQAEKIIVTRDTVSLVPRRWRHKCEIQLAIGLTGEYLNKASRVSQRRESGWHLLYVGRLLELKGVDIALRAVRQLKQWQPDVRFTIVGDGPSRSRLAKLAETLKIAENVEWVGWVPQHAMQDYYRSADLFVFPGLRDSGGTAVLEAMAHGLPVVCTELGGPGVMVNERCGRVLTAFDKSSEALAIDIAKAAREIMTTTGLREHLATGAKARARQFDFQNLVHSVYPISRRSAKIDQHEHTLQSSALVPRHAAS